MAIIQKMANKHRFYFVKDNISDAILTLLGAGYSPLKDCINNPEEDRKVIIDVENKTFWSTDLKCFENSANAIVNAFKEELKEISEETLETLEKLQNETMKDQQYLDFEADLNKEVKISKYRLAAMIAEGYINGMKQVDPSISNDDEELLKHVKLSAFKIMNACFEYIEEVEQENKRKLNC
jgi:hypothetical protein